MNNVIDINYRRLEQKTRLELSADTDRFAINFQANLADIGPLVNQALVALDNDEPEILRDYLSEIHSIIYPNASRVIRQQES